MGQKTKTKKDIYRIYANGVRALKHTINHRVQLQKSIVFQCFKPDRNEKNHFKDYSKPPQATLHSNKRSLRPVASYSRVKHGPHAPARAKNIQRLGEAVVVNDPGVDGEYSHQQDDVTARKHHVEHLPRKRVDISELESSEMVAMDSHLVIALLGHQSALPEHQVERGAGHECPVAHVAKHNRKQKGEGDDGVWSWRQGRGGGRGGGRQASHERRGGVTTHRVTRVMDDEDFLLLQKSRC